MDNSDKIPLICQRCNYSWLYGGKNPYFVTCPYCFTKVKVPEKYRNKKEITEIPIEKRKFSNMAKRIK